jgi:hypothetical protein
MPKQVLTNGAVVTGSAEEAAAAAARSLANSSDDGDARFPGNGASAHPAPNGDGTPDPFGGATEEQIRSARQQGWTEKFRGDPVDFVDAKTFYERGQQINPILRARVGPLEEENRRLKAALANTNSQLAGIDTRLQEQDKHAKARQIFELRAQKAEAIDNNEGAKVIEIETKIAELEKPAPTPVQRASQVEVEPALQKAVNDFTAAFDWYGKDKRKTALTGVIADEIAGDSPHLKGKPEFFDELERRVRKEFQMEGGNGSASVEPAHNGNPAPVAARGRSFNDLPRETQQIADMQIRQKLFKDRAEYLRYYEWD